VSIGKDFGWTRPVEVGRELHYQAMFIEAKGLLTMQLRNLASVLGLTAICSRALVILRKIFEILRLGKSCY
jgi:hypothetical protein